MGSERPEKEPVALSQWRTGGSPGKEQRLLKMRRDSIPFAQWSLGALGADSVLPFALTNSTPFRLTANSPLG